MANARLFMKNKIRFWIARLVQSMITTYEIEMRPKLIPEMRELSEAIDKSQFAKIPRMIEDLRAVDKLGPHDPELTRIETLASFLSGED